jgi:hypothetical protein
MTKRIVSKQFTLAWRDIARGLIMAVLTPALFIIQQSIDAGIWVFDWHTIAMASVGGGVGYLIKNLLEPTKVIQKV